MFRSKRRDGAHDAFAAAVGDRPCEWVQREREKAGFAHGTPFEVKIGMWTERVLGELFGETREVGEVPLAQRSQRENCFEHARDQSRCVPFDGSVGPPAGAPRTRQKREDRSEQVCPHGSPHA